MSTLTSYFDGRFPKASLLLLGFILNLLVFIQPHHGSNNTIVVAFVPNNVFYHSSMLTASNRNNLVCFLTQKVKQQEENYASNTNKSFSDENQNENSRENINVVSKIRSWARRLTGISISSIVSGKRRRRRNANGSVDEINAGKVDFDGEIPDSLEMEEDDGHTEVERATDVLQNSMGEPPAYYKKQQQQFLGAENDRILAAKVAIIARERRKAEEERRKTERNVTMTLKAEEDKIKERKPKEEQEEEQDIQAERIVEEYKEEEKRKHMADGKTTEKRKRLEENEVNIVAETIVAGLAEKETKLMVIKEATEEKVGDNVQAERIIEGYQEEAKHMVGGTTMGKILEEKEDNIVEIGIGEGQDEEETQKMVTVEAIEHELGEKEENIQTEEIIKGYKEEEETKHPADEKTREKVLEEKKENLVAEKITKRKVEAALKRMGAGEKIEKNLVKKEENILAEILVKGQEDEQKEQNSVAAKEQHKDKEIAVARTSEIVDESVLVGQPQQAILEEGKKVPENSCADGINVEVIRREELVHIKPSETIREVLNRPRTTEEDAIISLRYGKMSAEDRAFNILLDLGLIEICLDPDDPKSCVAEDDEFYYSDNR
jgi:hypothetical protein